MKYNGSENRGRKEARWRKDGYGKRLLKRRRRREQRKNWKKNTSTAHAANTEGVKLLATNAQNSSVESTGKETDTETDVETDAETDRDKHIYIC